MDEQAPQSTTKRSGFLGWAIAVLTAVAVLIALRSLGGDISGGEDQVPWRTDINQVGTDAEQNDTPRLLYFGADWCPPCVRMRGNVFSQAHVADAIDRRFVPIKLDLTDRNATQSIAHQTARRFGVQAIPTLIILSPDGEPLARRSGYIPADDLLDWLDNRS